MRPNYKTNDPRGWCGDPSRGAALGRPGVSGAPHDTSAKLVLRRVRIDQGGYDPNGTYFGIGRPIYWYANDEGTIDGTIRADDRENAKSIVRGRYPKARFYR